MEYTVKRAHIGYPTGATRIVDNPLDAAHLIALGVIEPLSEPQAEKAAPAPANKAARKPRNKAAPGLRAKGKGTA